MNDWSTTFELAIVRSFLDRCLLARSNDWSVQLQAGRYLRPAPTTPSGRPVPASVPLVPRQELFPRITLTGH